MFEAQTLHGTVERVKYCFQWSTASQLLLEASTSWENTRVPDLEEVEARRQ